MASGNRRGGLLKFFQKPNADSNVNSNSCNANMDSSAAKFASSPSSSTCSRSSSLFNPLLQTCPEPNKIITAATSTTALIQNGLASFWGSFHWQNTLFVSASTFFYTLLFLTCLYFWWANRQFHFKKRKKDGSKLSSIATRKDAEELHNLNKKKGRAAGGHDDDDSTTSDISDLDKDQDDDEDTLALEDADLSDYEEEDSEYEDYKQQKHKQEQEQEKDPQKSPFFANLPPEKRRVVKDLTAVVSNMEVFSYLSTEAFVQCLEHMEYIDLKRGQQLFSDETLDGSLYAVVSGKVKCQFEFDQQAASSYEKRSYHPSMNLDSYSYDESGTTDPLISFTAGEGDIVTSLLTMLLGLVRQCQERSTPERSDDKETQQRLPIVPSGISVKAFGSADNTQIVRVPPKCFLALLDKFPKDIHRISQTVIARMQRVTLQTVVRCLGLQREIVLHTPHESTVMSLDRIANHPEEWGRLRASLPNYLPNAAQTAVKDQVTTDAATVTAANIMGRQQKLSPLMKTIVQRLKQVGEIIAVPAGHTLIETGDSPDGIYMILHGALDVGMNVTGSSATARQSNRRTSTLRPPADPSKNGQPRRNIFPQASAIKESKKQRRQSAARAQQMQNASSASNMIFSRIYQALPGETVGRLSCFTSDASIVTVRNSSEYESTLLFKIPKDHYDRIVAEHPMALTQCLDSILGRLVSPIVCLLDWNVEWMHIQAGEDIVHRGDICDSMFAVLNGRLRAAPLSSYYHSRQRTNTSSVGPVPPPPAPLQERDTSTETTSFLRRRLLQRRRNANKNVPKVSNAPPPPSRRMMNNSNDDGGGEEYGRGAIIGEIEILTGADWSFDVYASRHSELARVPVSVINAIIRMCPSAGLHLAKVVASQVQSKYARKNITNSVSPQARIMDSPQKHAPPGTVDARSSILPSYGLSLATIAVVPLLEGDFDLNSFCQTLKDALHHGIAPTKLITKDFAKEELGDEIWMNRNAMHSLKMTRLLGDMEENYRLVVYQADMRYSWWTRLCIQQADCILLVVRAEKAPPQKKVEACLSWAFSALNVKIQLVVLQTSHAYVDEDDDDDVEAIMNPAAMESSDQLNDWSEQRYWIAGHHLIRMPFHKHELDFTRMCRRVTGRSVGVVLGGGGARGLAHIGVIQALNEAGITVDFVGGTSQGAYIGALYAMNPDDFDALVKAARFMADTMSNVMEKLLDLTLPLVSFFNGYRFNRGIQKSLGKRRIQDFILNFFCVSCDIRNNVQVVHTKGVAWKYVRASMSLQSYIPPLSEEGSLLVDGGYMNVLPADVMKQMGAKTVIAVDVTQEVILDNYEYGTHLSGWYLLWNSWNPFVKTVKIPSMGDISERLAWVSADRHKKKVKEHIDLFLEPPVANYGVLEYDKFEEIVKLGYEYAKPRVESFAKKNPHLVSHKTSNK